MQQTILSRPDVPRVDRVDFNLSVGTAVPAHVHVVEVPDTLIEIHPEWRGHQYFVVRDEIMIVDRGRKVVARVPVGSSQVRRGGSSSTTIGLSEPEIRRVQMVLIEKGLYRGEPDGRLGPNTRQAIIAFQRQQGIDATGEIETRTITALGLPSNFGQGGQAGASTSGSGQGAQSPAAGAGQGSGAASNPPSGSSAGAPTTGQRSGSGSEPSASGQSGQAAGAAPSGRSSATSGQNPSSGQTPAARGSRSGQGEISGQGSSEQGNPPTPQSRPQRDGSPGTQSR